MIFAPHILQVKVITPMDKDEFGQDLFLEQVVNTGRRYASAVVMITLPKSFHSDNGSVVSSNYHVVCERELLYK